LDGAVVKRVPLFVEEAEQAEAVGGREPLDEIVQ
jgi:hypothetical protein